MSNTAYQVHTAEGSEWMDSAGKLVLSLDGEWIADIDDDGGKVQAAYVRRRLHEVMGWDPDRLTIEVSAYADTSGDRNDAYCYASSWDVTVG